VDAPPDVIIKILEGDNVVSVDKKSIHLVAQQEIAVYGFSNAL